jgi:16S rRNA (cytidine1402-2'-O)-methyltransferase
MPGTLVLCATPIGNLGDTTPRLLEVLAKADVIYAEDTRRAGRLLRRHAIDRAPRSYFVGNEAERAVQLRDELANGMTVALLTDAGTPSVSDPGLSAVRAALAVGAAVTTVAGPSAVTAALAVSGLPADRFVFEGFLPRSGAGRTAVLAALAGEQRTSVIFSSPRRIGSDLGDLEATLGGDRRVVVVRELTKLHEEVWRGTLEEAASRWADGTKGEVTLVVEGADEPVPDLDAALEEVGRLVADGLSRSEAVRVVATTHSVSRRRLYEMATRQKPEDRPGVED